jgi:hypothetical protein
MGGLDIWYWLFVVAILAIFAGAIYGVIRMLPKRLWRTVPVTVSVFLLGFVFAIATNANQMNWGAMAQMDRGHWLMVGSAVVFGSVAFGLMPAAVALIWCAVHNRRVARREET